MVSIDFIEDAKKGDAVTKVISQKISDWGAIVSFYNVYVFIKVFIKYMANLVDALIVSLFKQVSAFSDTVGQRIVFQVDSFSDPLTI